MPEKTLTGEDVHRIHSHLNDLYGCEVPLPPWDELSWDEKDAAQATADELNEARKGTL